MDLLLTSMPRYVYASEPPAGIAHIVAAVRKANYQAKAIDLNLVFFNSTFQKNYDLWCEIDQWMLDVPLPNLEVRSQDLQAGLSQTAQQVLKMLFQDFIDVIEAHNPKWLGISLFSHNSRKMTSLFLRYLKERRPQQKIILGGAGTSPRYPELFEQVDCYVEGEGEEAIVEILKGNLSTAPGVNGNPIVQIENMDELPWPDYSDFPMRDYESLGKVVRITGSRGCIRRCNFCNIHVTWPRYRRRSGKSIAEEMIHHHESLETHPDHFVFTDSLINGHLPTLRDICLHLIEYQEKRRIVEPNFTFKFDGQFIALGPQNMTPEDFILLKRAGCHRLFIGIESGSQELRWKMNKKFTNDHLNYCVEELHKNKISMVWLMIVGHAEETPSNFAETLDLFRKNHWRNSPDWKIEASLHEFQPYPEVEWTKNNANALKLDKDGYWVFSGNPLLTRKERINRLLALEDELLRLGYFHHSLTMSKYPGFTMRQFVEKNYPNMIDRVTIDTLLQGY